LCEIEKQGNYMALDREFNEKYTCTNFGNFHGRDEWISPIRSCHSMETYKTGEGFLISRH
jgi:hypothetical protein